MKNFKWGIELEMYVPYDKAQSFSQAMQDAKMMISSDSSICAPRNMSGIEIKTRPLNFSKMSEQIAKIGRICEEHGAEVNKSTGFHIHTSHRSFFNYKKLRHIMLTWLAIEDVLFATQPESRMNNHYCQRRLVDLVKKNGLPDIPEDKDRLVDFLGGQDRYYALNIASLHKHGTLEVRLHSGTTDPKKMQMWMALMRAFYEYATTNWNGKGPVIKSLFDMTTDEAKVQAVWNLLGLEPEVREHFDHRVQRFLLPKLAEQQVAAKKIMTMNVTWEKVQEKMKKMREEYDRINIQRESLLGVFRTQ